MAAIYIVNSVDETKLFHHKGRGRHHQAHAYDMYLCGRIALSISSVCWFFCASIGGSLLARGG